MPYGLDYSEIRYETDHDGNRLKATIPYTMFSALIEFWIAARRAQTAKLEASARPGQYKGSLQSAQLPDENVADETPRANTKPATFSPFPNDKRWNSLVARMPEEPLAVAQPPEPAAAPIPEPRAAEAEPAQSVAEATKPKADRVFYREFMAKPPAEVMALIAKGTYFVRAWREHRGLTLTDAAELLGLDKTTIIWHESGRSAPKIKTLEKFAQGYDVPILQITPKPGTDDSPFEGRKQRVRANVSPAKAAVERTTRRVAPPVASEATEPSTKKRHAAPEPLSPAGTVYPEGVLSSLLAGKSPILAWRLYRGMSLKDLADQYGGRAGNVKAMEEQSFLRPPTIAKLCAVFHCKPEQLLRPADLEARRDPKRITEHTNGGALAPSPVVAPLAIDTPRERRVAPVDQPMSVIGEAFVQAKTIDTQRESMRQRARLNTADRLARMQRELSGR
ncbi:helix-turn-helix transcriptional regulator [Paraburkholderia mimosarum]|uniref:helix-turn-helix transcriptional regulator n=1 Tax=Paraburkholderia mimosarum TaxID=312026 RepID=UPI00041D50F1|nr:helix-turn-helix transcriptional regulator [Paraburkholderia mimosarum]